MNDTQAPPAPGSVLDCAGYRKLLSAVDEQETKWKDDRPRKAMEWAVVRAKHYAEKTGLSAEAILDAWEERRNYWHVNYYQDANQPLLDGGQVRVFDTTDELLDSIGKGGFRCPMCEGVSKSPYECDSGALVDGKPCNWKVYGLLRDLGKGVSVYVKEKLKGELLFMPVAWEQNDSHPPSAGLAPATSGQAVSAR